MQITDDFKLLILAYEQFITKQQNYLFEITRKWKNQNYQNIIKFFDATFKTI